MRVGCDGQMDKSNEEIIGVFNRRIIWVCPACKLCHELDGEVARNQMNPIMILVWGTVCQQEVNESTVNLKPCQTHHYDDDHEWLLWKDLVGA